MTSASHFLARTFATDYLGRVTDLPGRLHKRILERKLFRKGQAILVAVSGGVDSMVLLHLLHELARKESWKLVVAHLNHRLRGTASQADQKLVRQTTRKLNLRFVTADVDVLAEARKEKLSIEMAARKVRHAFLAKAAVRLRIPAIALAHHADDQVELFFLRLFRGSGNLGGMKWRNLSPSTKKVELVRPLLGFTKQELLDFAKTKGIGFREDESNQSLAFQRNRIRHELLPLLRNQYQEALLGNVLRAMDISGEESDFIEKCAGQWLLRLRGQKRNPRSFFGFLASQPFHKLPVALQRRIIHSQLIKLGVAPEFDLVERLRRRAENALHVPMVEKGVPLQSIFRETSGEIRLINSRKATFQTTSQQIQLRGKAGIIDFDGIRVQWTKRAQNGYQRRPSTRLRIEQFDADKIGSRIELRHWRRGDRFFPIGMTTAVKIQNLLTNAKVPRAQRHTLAVGVAESGEIFWVEGLRISENFKLEEQTRRQLKWEWVR